MSVSHLDILVMRTIEMPKQSDCIYGTTAAQIPSHHYPEKPAAPLLFMFLLPLSQPSRVHKPASLWFRPQSLKCALYWHLYSTFPTLPLEAFCKAMNYMPVTHWIHSCKREVVITLLAIKLIMPPTIEFLYVCTKEIKLPSCPWYHEHIRGRWADRELMMDQRDGVLIQSELKIFRVYWFIKDYGHRVVWLMARCLWWSWWRKCLIHCFAFYISPFR